MAEFMPVSTVSDLSVLDDADMVAGYFHGFHGGNEPGSDKSRSFWHGWRNGMADSGRMEIDHSQRSLAEEIVRKQRAH